MLWRSERSLWADFALVWAPLVRCSTYSPTVFMSWRNQIAAIVESQAPYEMANSALTIGNTTSDAAQARQQRTSWLLASKRSSGPGRARHWSTAMGQRGWNEHPAGGSKGL